VKLPPGDPKLPLVANARRVEQHSSIRKKTEHRMAEGLLGGVLGDEDEKPEVETPDALASAEAFASAVAAKLAGNDPEVARRTADFLIDQSQLLKVQKKHLEEEHAARLHFLQGQAREVDIRRFGLRLRVGFRFLLHSLRP
jgi:hypothetical protein